jgi:hypothetical protein
LNEFSETESIFSASFDRGKSWERLEVEVDQARAIHCVAGNARRTIVEDVIMVVVAASSDIHRLTAVKRECDSE